MIMIKIIIRFIFLAAFVVLAACSSEVLPGYYFDPVNGDDTNSGTSSKAPFRSLAKLREIEVKPDEHILLKSGTVFEEAFYFSGRGEEDALIVIDKYGGEEKPHIKVDGREDVAVRLYNCEHIVIRNLEISNRGEHPIGNGSGLLVEIENYGKARNTIVEYLFIHDVYGNTEIEEGGGHGIRIQNYTEKDTILSCFDRLLIQHCYIKDCQRDGIRFIGNWIRSKWLPSTEVVIRHNVIDGVPGDGIVPVGCEAPLVEYNVMKNSPLTLPPSQACDGIWPWSCDNTLIQYNVVSDHKSQVDGYGFDSDWNCTNTVFQYNLSFNNDGGFLLICNSGGWPTDWSIGNIGTRVRYNISINDGLRNYTPKDYYFSPVIHSTGPLENTLIEKNLFYICRKPEPQIDRTLLHQSNWGGYADSTAFVNNYIFAEEPNVAVLEGRSTRNIYRDNQYVGPLEVTTDGFISYEGDFNKQLWYDETDENWDKLIEFVKDKTVPLFGKEVPVLDIINN